jgi:hypothetical protein
VQTLSGAADLPDRIAAAVAVANTAAAAAGVRVGIVEDPQRLHSAAALLATVWATEPGQDPLPHHVMRAVAHAGGAAHVAYSGDYEDLTDRRHQTALVLSTRRRARQSADIRGTAASPCLSHAHCAGPSRCLHCHLCL